MKTPGKTKIVSVDEIRERQGLSKRGENSDLVLELRAKIKELEAKIEVLSQGRRIATKLPADAKKDLDKVFEIYGCEPIEELIVLLTETDAMGKYKMSDGDRATLWEKLLQYRHPKLKSMEVKGKIDHNLRITVQEFGTGEIKSTKTVTLDAQTGETLEVIQG